MLQRVFIIYYHLWFLWLTGLAFCMILFLYLARHREQHNRYSFSPIALRNFFIKEIFMSWKKGEADLFFVFLGIYIFLISFALSFAYFVITIFT